MTSSAADKGSNFSSIHATRCAQKSIRLCVRVKVCTTPQVKQDERRRNLHPLSLSLNVNFCTRREQGVGLRFPSPPNGICGQVRARRNWGELVGWVEECRELS